MIQQSLIAKHILNIIPSVSEKVQNININYESFFDSDQSVESLTKLMLTAHDLGIIDEQQVLTILNENIVDEIKEKKISLNINDIEINRCNKKHDNNI